MTGVNAAVAENGKRFAALGWMCQGNADNQSYEITNLGTMIYADYGLTRAPAECKGRHVVT